MTARVSRADLLQCLERQGGDELDSILDCFGYKRPLSVRNKRDTVSLEIPISELLGSPEPTPQPEPSPGSERPAEVFYRVKDSEPSTLLPPPQQAGQPDVPDWVRSIDHQALDLQKAGWEQPETPLPHQPLVVWSKLWPLMRSLLSQTQTRKCPDVSKLVKLTAKAEQLRRIPYQQREHWAAKVILLMDRPKRLNGLNQDYVSLEQQLVKQRGEAGFESWFVLDLASRKMLCGDDEKSWHNPDPETPLLILSDLGIYDKSGEATRQWLQFGQSLRQSGCQAFVLVPAPERYLSDELVYCFHCISWDRYSVLSFASPTGLTQGAVRQRIERDREKADDLLAMCSMATDIEPGLLRSIRYQFTVGQRWDIGHELLVWNHDQLTRASNAVVADAGVQELYRTRLEHLFFLHAPELAEPLYWHIRRQMAQAFTLDYVDALCFTGLLAGIKDDDLLAEAERYLKQFILATYQQQQHDGLLFGGQQLLRRQSRQSWQDKDYLSSLWAILKNRSGSDVPRPEYLDHIAANAFLVQRIKQQRLRLIQLGEFCYLGNSNAIADLLLIKGSFLVKPYVMAEIFTDQDVVLEEFQGEIIDHKLTENECLEWPLNGSERILHIAGRFFHIEALCLPSWAAGLACGAAGLTEPNISPNGEDEYGVYFDLALPYDETRSVKLGTSSIDIVITFSSEDKPIAEILEKHLKDLGYRIWVAENFMRGSNIFKEAQKVIKESKCVIAVWSWSAQKSTSLAQEYQSAMMNRKLITLKIDDADYPFPRLGQVLDFGSWNGDKSSEHFRMLFLKVSNYCASYESSDFFTQRFRYIFPQTFNMGSEKSSKRTKITEAVHQVTLSKGYWLADTTVTQAFWKQVMKNQPSGFKGGMKPVEQVNWYGAHSFIDSLKKTFPLLEVRLPTESEWECACRANTNSEFSFGDFVDSSLIRAGRRSLPYPNNFVLSSDKLPESNNHNGPVEVKSYLPNDWGLYEMHGNVWEWCQDAFGAYPNYTVSDPKGAFSSDQRVVRGGSWKDKYDNCGSATRNKAYPSLRHNAIGMRLAIGNQCSPHDLLSTS